MFGIRLKKKPKSNILNEFADLNKVVIHSVNIIHLEDGLEVKPVFCTNGGVRLPKISVSVEAQRKQTSPDKTSHSAEPVSRGRGRRD